MFKKTVTGLAFAGLLVFCCGDTASCNIPQTSDTAQNNQQEQLDSQAVQQVGMPNIIHFREKRILKRIYEDRDKELATTTYIVDLNGKLHKFCDSVGYPIPYATEYTSPQRPAKSWETYEQGNLALPQADPNGLFSPADAEGSWVMCQNPKDPTDVAPVYAEPRLIGSPFPLNSVD